MSYIQKIRDKSYSFVLLGILIICGGFILSSCGSGPKEKASNPQAGEFAIDFSKECPSGKECNIAASNPGGETMVGKGLTVESWVKINSITAEGGIFGRMDASTDSGSGIFLYVNNTSTEPRIRAAVKNRGTGTTTWVSSVRNTADMVVGKWYHVAAVLTDEAHAGHIGSCSGTQTDTLHHLDLYVGDESSPSEWKACVLTGPAGAASSFIEIETGKEETTASKLPGGITDTNDGILDGDTALDGAIDQARFWGVERTAAQIEACRTSRLDVVNGSCSNDGTGVGDFTLQTDLYHNFQFNEGTGKSTADQAGGSAEKSATAPLEDWEGGWIDGVL